ncbi:unnamed protein product [Pieris brassicae]|uniref:Uncharacterized protein n=1 Tax=Pieris brassicae TaxID=7116 RepID=A0A9P0TYT9_PIEBR|nr:unnamed protein product [Pieris brassicae]
MREYKGQELSVTYKEDYFNQIPAKLSPSRKRQMCVMIGTDLSREQFFKVQPTYQTSGKFGAVMSTLRSRINTEIKDLTLQYSA